MGIGNAIGAGIGAAADLAGLGLQINELNKARGIAERYANQGTANINSAVGQYRKSLSPYETLGGIGLSMLENPFEADKMPGYAFTQRQGSLGVTNSSAARGLANSGAALQAMDRFNTGLANTYYQNYFGDANSLMNTGIGTTSAANTAGITGAEAGSNLGMQAAQTGASAYGAMGKAFGETGVGLGGIGLSLGGLL